MARNNQRGGTTTRRAPKDLGRRVKKKPCALCRDNTEWVDYKDVPMLRKYMSDRGKIRSRRVTGNCAQHQRALAMAIKTARELVLLPYTQRTVTERPGGRGGGRDRGERGERAERTLSDTIGADAPRDRAADVEIISDEAAAAPEDIASADLDAPGAGAESETVEAAAEAGVEAQAEAEDDAPEAQAEAPSEDGDA
jgi:small subunit ribosomal protein S18